MGNEFRPDVEILNKKDAFNDLQDRIAQYNGEHIDAPLSAEDSYHICGMISTLSDILGIFGYKLLLVAKANEKC